MDIFYQLAEATKAKLETIVDEEVSDAIVELNNRMAILEGGGDTGTPPSLTSNPVSWSNLSEIVSGGEKLTNISFDQDTIEVGDQRRVTTGWENSGKTINVGDIITLVNSQYKWSRTVESNTLPAGTKVVLLSDHSNKGLVADDIVAITGTNASGFYTWSGNGTFKPAEEGSTWDIATEITLEESLNAGITSITFAKTGDDITAITVVDSNAGTTTTYSYADSSLTPLSDFSHIRSVKGNFSTVYYDPSGNYYLDIMRGTYDVSEISLVDDTMGSSDQIVTYTENESTQSVSSGGSTVTETFFSSANQATNNTEPFGIQTITEFSASDVGKQFRAIQTNTNRGYEAGQIYEILTQNGTNATHTGGGTGLSINQQGTQWELLTNLRTNPVNWSVASGTLDLDQLALGNIKGTGGQVSVRQDLQTSIPPGTDLTVRVGRPEDQLSGNVGVVAVFNSGSQGYAVEPSLGVVNFTVPADKVMVALRLNTNHGNHIITNVSMLQGSTAGGEMEATSNTLKKIGGASEFNAGASSSQSIPGGQDGYYQFQYGGSGHIVVGLTYSDVGFGVPAPIKFSLNLLENGTVFSEGYNSGEGFCPAGTWLRIRHYSGDNIVKFQRKQDVYYADPAYELPTTTTGGHATNHTFAVLDRPLVIALQTVNGMTEGNIYRMHTYNTSNGNGQIYELDGTLVAWIGGRGSKWEVARNAGQGYVTFHTATETTTNNPLILDTSFKHVGAQLNDATIAS